MLNIERRNKMKGTKLLTSIATLALVIGLGACNETEDNNTSQSGSSSEDVSLIEKGPGNGTWGGQRLRSL